MDAEPISFGGALEEIASLLKRRQYEPAVQAIHVLSQAAMRQNIQLILQRYLAELSMECLELCGQLNTALDICEHSLEQYAEAADSLSTEAKKDQITLEMRKLCLLVKLDMRDQLVAQNKHLISLCTAQQQATLQPILNRINRYSSASSGRLTQEQQGLGLFHLSDRLVREGAKAFGLA